MIIDKEKIKDLFEQSEEGEELWFAYQDLPSLTKVKMDSNVLTDKFALDEIKQILNYNYRYQDNSVQAIGETEDGRFFSLIAGPEHPDSGWGASLVWLKECVASSLNELIDYGLTQEEKTRFNISQLMIDFEKQKFEHHIKHSSPIHHKIKL